MIKLYNTLTLKKEKFSPLINKIVRIYSCGPTVYSYPHIGNMRSYVFSDILRRVLEFNGYKVIQVINITDVGHLLQEEDELTDRIEISAKKEKKSVEEIVMFYTNVFKRYLNLINIKQPSYMPRASKFINQQLKFIKILEEKGFTYETEKGIYFDTSKIKNYGKFGRKKPQKKEEFISRIEKSYKKNPEDFALWRFSPKSKKRQQEWDSSWGKGFPGWHTECLVMAEKFLGVPFDIHTGGVDHIFVHHQNEIAQAQAVYSNNLAKFWLHNEFVLINGEKISKSLGNIITLDDLIKKGFTPLSLRFLFLQSHYRNKINFTYKSLESSQRALLNFYIFLKKLNFLIKNNKFFEAGSFQEFEKKLKKVNEKIITYLNDDLKTQEALGVLFDFVKYIEDLISKRKITKDICKKTLNFFYKFDKVFGIINKKEIEYSLPLYIKKLIIKREKLRKQKNFKKSDNIRKKIQNLGFIIEDTAFGPFVYKNKFIFPKMNQ